MQLRFCCGYTNVVNTAIPQAGRYIKYTELQKLIDRTAHLIKQKSEVLLNRILEGMSVSESVIPIWSASSGKESKHFSVAAIKIVDVSLQSAQDFIVFMRAEIKTTDCEHVEVLTSKQTKSQNWFYFRFATVTASKIY